MRQCVARVAALLFLSTAALAQGVVDQQNDPETTRSFSCGSGPIGNGTLLQSFQPEASSLIAVELRLKIGSSFPSEGVTTTVTIFDDQGNALGKSEPSVSAPADSSVNQVLVRFDFDEISVTPGDTYLIEWVSPTSGHLTWMGTTSGADSYANGTAFSCVGNVWPVSGTDFNFVTYAAEAKEKSCRDLIEELMARYDGLVDDGVLSSRRASGSLRTLAYVNRLLDSGRPRIAMLKLYVLRSQMRFAVRLRWFSWDVADELVGEIDEIISCIRESLPPSSPPRRRRSCKG